MAGTFVPGTVGVTSSEVEISISCRNLRNKDVLSKSDPMCVVSFQPYLKNELVELCRTEILKNSWNPDFTKKVSMIYKFEEQQPLRFEVYDVDSKSTRLTDHDFLGAANTTLGQLVSSGRLQMALEGTKGGATTKPTIIVSVEELSTNKDEVMLQFCGRNLPKKDVFGKSDPYLIIYKSNESGQYTVVHKTEVIKNTSSPTWRHFNIPVRSLCNNDYDRHLKFECYDYNSNGKHEFMCEFYTTLKKLSGGPGADNVYFCVDPKKEKKKKSSSKQPPEIVLITFEKRQMYSFLDYIRGGTQLHCMISIDFTASNGPPSDSRSLHFVSSMPNSYEQAITSVGRIIQDYDTDKLFPVLGFGAQIPPNGQVSHEFFVNMHPTNPYCLGIEGVLQAYKNCIMQVKLYGPTNFAPCINHAARFAVSNQGGSQYFILLIITDGAITDMLQTKEAIVQASDLPMSIIIVGVGTADFSAMEELDADTVALTAGGRKATRDIVQFVPFRKFQAERDPYTSGIRLASHVLAEIPTQFLSYMRSHNIKPQIPQFAVPLPPDPEQILKM